jgi:hypothetical protein
MKKSTMMLWALIGSIPCSLMAADGVLAAKDEAQKNEVKKVSVSKKHGTPVAAKKHGKKKHAAAQSTTESEKNSSKT